jgi:hypothetical protein
MAIYHAQCAVHGLGQPSLVSRRAPAISLMVRRKHLRGDPEAHQSMGVGFREAAGTVPLPTSQARKRAPKALCRPRRSQRDSLQLRALLWLSRVQPGVRSQLRSGVMVFHGDAVLASPGSRTGLVDRSSVALFLQLLPEDSTVALACLPSLPQRPR